MPFLLGSYLDEVRSAVNESVTVRSEERGIYTPSRNLTVQIYIGSFDHRKSRCLPGVPTLTYTRGLLTLCEQCFILTSEVPRSTLELPT